MKRKKFILSSGAFALGAFSISGLTFKFLREKFESKEKKELKVKQNPLAVGRKAKDVKNGAKNG